MVACTVSAPPMMMKGIQMSMPGCAARGEVSAGASRTLVSFGGGAHNGRRRFPLGAGMGGM